MFLNFKRNVTMSKMKHLFLIAIITLLSKVNSKAMNKESDQGWKSSYDYDQQYNPLVDGRPIYVPHKDFMKNDNEFFSSNKDYDLDFQSDLDSKNVEKILNDQQSHEFGNSNLESDEVFIAQRSKANEKIAPNYKTSNKVTEKLDEKTILKNPYEKIDKKTDNSVQSSKLKTKKNKYSKVCKVSKSKSTMAVNNGKSLNHSEQVVDFNNFALAEDRENIINANIEEDGNFIKTSPKLSDVIPPIKKATVVTENLKSNKGHPSEFIKNFEFPTEKTEEETDEHLPLQEEVKSMFGPNFRSFVFNPNAPKQARFQECNTSKSESGFCRYVQHCLLPSVVSSIQQFMNNVCIIEGRFIGVCCPEFPVHAVPVKWKNSSQTEEFADGAIETPKECGIGSNTRIVGGLSANVKAWPWMVALLNNKKNFFCGGSLINNRYVLTAAHCTFGVRNNEIIARVGEFDLSSDQGNHEDIMVEKIKRHGHYNRFTLRNDIALLKLHKPVHFNEFVKTICFPDSNKNYTGKIATLAGWGRTKGSISAFSSDVLQEASFPVITNEECASTHNLPIPPSLICTAAPSEDKGACNGDSGGPLMMLDDEDRWKVIGVVSWGRRGCNTKFPSVFTRIAHYLDWIKQHAI